MNFTNTQACLLYMYMVIKAHLHTYIDLYLQHTHSLSHPHTHSCIHANIHAIVLYPKVEKAWYLIFAHANSIMYSCDTQMIVHVHNKL